MKDIKIFACPTAEEFTKEICDTLSLKMGRVECYKFANDNNFVQFKETVREQDIYLIQTTEPPVNERIMELLIMIDAMKRASAGRINAIIPYYGYARQDRKTKARDPITAKLVADLLVAAGADRVLTMDLHAAQIQGYFNIPVDHLLGVPILVKYFKDRAIEDLVIVSPDHGSVTRARNMAQPLNAPIAIIDKRRPEPNKSEIMNIIGEIEGMNCVLVDDMIDTAGTITNGATALMEMGAKSVMACATHPILSGPAIERLVSSPIHELVLLNTVPIPEEKRIPSMKILSVAPLFAEAMLRVFTNDSISKLFD